MTTESTPAASFIDCVKVLRPERRQLLLGLPHFITYLIAGVDGEAEMAKPERGIGAAEYTYLALVWDAFEITGDPDLPEVSPQGNQIRSVYSPNQKNTQLLGSLA